MRFAAKIQINFQLPLLFFKINLVQFEGITGSPGSRDKNISKTFNELYTTGAT